MWLFVISSSKKKERWFQTELDAIKAVEAILKNLSKNSFSHVFEQFEHRWDKGIALQEDYIERDKSIVA